MHLAEGADFTCCGSIADWLVDDYFPVFDRLGDEIDDLENDVMRRPINWVVERLFAVRRDLLTIRHAVNPQREIFNQLTNRDLRLIKPERVVYFRDVYDHLIRLTDELDTLPRAGRHHARHLPLAGQQQPVRDGQEADRGDGHPGRRRRGRRASSA